MTALKSQWVTGKLAILVLFSPAHVSCDRKGSAQQPVEFNHRVHVENRMSCTFCHSGAEKHSQATIPSVTFCMTCHSFVKADSPEVLKVKEYMDRKEEIPWKRIYKMPESAAVFFDHRRHAAAGVGCDACHGDVGSRDELRREKEHTMGFCVECHRQNSSKFRNERMADDCAICHR